MDTELAAWFDSTFPWRGSFPQFVNAALAAFKAEFGDRLPPHKVLEQAMGKMGDTF